MKTAVILLGHGSRAEEGNTALAEVAGLVHTLGGVEAMPAYLQFCSPSLPEAVESEIKSGAEKVVIVPYFLYSGNHVMKDIPEELDAIRAKHPKVEITMTEHLGAHEKLARIVLERLEGIL